MPGLASSRVWSCPREASGRGHPLPLPPPTPTHTGLSACRSGLLNVPGSYLPALGVSCWLQPPPSWSPGFPDGPAATFLQPSLAWFKPLAPLCSGPSSVSPAWDPGTAVQPLQHPHHSLPDRAACGAFPPTPAPTMPSLLLFPCPNILTPTHSATPPRPTLPLLSRVLSTLTLGKPSLNAQMGPEVLLRAPGTTWVHLYTAQTTFWFIIRFAVSPPQRQAPCPSLHSVIGALSQAPGF